MAINLNTKPYYDDFDELKNYKKVLFKPGYAVQARELTQLQTSLQNQLSKVGEHIYKEGSIVVGGAFDLDLKAKYITVDSSVPNDIDVVINTVDGVIFTGATTGVKAQVYAVADRATWGYDKHVLMIRYTAGSVIGTEQYQEFQVGETISGTATIGGVTQTVSFVVGSESGLGSIFGIDEGVVFSRGYFISFAKQRVILDPKNTAPTLKIGFKSDESIVTYEEDETLLDNAQGTYNYAAPGADRLRVQPTLITSDIDAADVLPDYINVVTIKDGKVFDWSERSEYARLANEFAKRTFDESGDYIVDGFTTRTREHLDDGTNEGFYTAENGGDFTKFIVEIEPGVAYVKGFEINQLQTARLTVDKNIDNYREIEDEVLTVRLGNYLTLSNVLGYIDVNGDTVEEVNLLSSGDVQIATAGVKSLIRVDDGEYRLFLNDVQIDPATTLTFADVGKVTLPANNFSATVTTPILKDTFANTLIYPVSFSNVRTIANSLGNATTTYIYQDTFQSTASTGVGTVTISETTSHTWDYSGTLSDIEKDEIIVVLDTESAPHAAGYIVPTTDFTAVVSSSTSMQITFGGDVASYSGSFHVMAKVRRSDANPITKTLEKNNYVLYHIDRTGGNTTDPYGWGNTLNPISLGVTDLYDIVSIKKIVTNTLPAVADWSDPLVYTDITSQFDFFNGQDDLVYGQATMTPITAILDSGASEEEAYILVTFDYFAHNYSNTGYGFFNANSYPISDTPTANELYPYQYPLYRSPTNGNVYRLQNCFDFRPVRSSPSIVTATDSASILNAKVWESETDTIPNDWEAQDIAAGHISIPFTYENMQFDYSIYLARRAVLVMDSQGNYSTVDGIPDIYPVTPRIPAGVMGISRIYIPPYPSLSASLVRTLTDNNMNGIMTERITNRRFTMRDIGVLKQRVDNLEYYTSLNTLEKNVKDLLIVDENGLDRFKNGFFVDPFNDHSLGSSGDPDYHIAVDSVEKVIRPFFETLSLDFEDSRLSSSGVVNTGGLITLPYNEVSYKEQNKYTTYRNVEFTSYRWIGLTTLSPDIDTWVDTETVDTVIMVGDGRPFDTVTSTTYGSWSTIVNDASVVSTGGATYEVWHRASGDRSFSSENIVTYDSKGLTLSNTAYTPAFGGVTKARKNRTGLAGFSKIGSVGNSTAGEYILGTYSSWNEAISAINGLVASGQLDDAGRSFIVENAGAGTATSTSSRNVTTTVTSAEVDRVTTSDGNVKDVSIIPYIRPQVINVIIRGLKPYTRFYAFFDNENMDSYTQWTDSDLGDGYYFEEGTKNLISSESGELNFYLRLPESGKRFRIGQKEISVTDSPTNSDADATSYSKSYFVANGLTINRDQVITETWSTKTTVFKDIETVVNVADVNTRRATVFGPSCTAYSFKVEAPENTAGLFLTSVDVFFQSKDPNLGVWFEIREMSADGGITRTTVPFSEVWYTSDEVTVSEDGTLPHNVKFPAPIFLAHDRQYAFVIHTEGLNPNYYLWISRLGETDLGTGEQVTGRQLTGTFYTTNNNLNWAIVPDIDPKIKFYRANFSTSTGTLLTGNSPYEFLVVDGSNGTDKSFSRIGEEIIGSQAITITGLAGTDYPSPGIVVGDIIKSETETEGGVVLDISGSVYYTTGFNFVAGQTIEVYESDGIALKDITGSIVSNGVSQGTGNLYRYNTFYNNLDEIKGYMALKNSNGQFFTNCVIRGSISNLDELSSTTVTVESFETQQYALFRLKPRTLVLPGTTCDHSFKTTPYGSTTLAATWESINQDTDYEFNSAQHVLSASEEIGFVPSIQNRSLLSTTTSWLSPVVDLGLSTTIFVRNLINDPVADEESVVSGGNILNKYISKIVTLASGQDAEDLQVRLTAYIPPNTNVRVWAKVANNEDYQPITQKKWFELENISNINSSAANKYDFVELSFKVPAYDAAAAALVDEYSPGIDPVDGIIYKKDGYEYIGIRQFMIKIALTGSDIAIVPRVTDLQAIALQL